jgi:RES domain-containing protein
VYCSRLLSLAALEFLVHLNPRLAPDDLTAFGIDLPDDVGERLAEAELPAGWGRRVAATRGIGDRWLTAARSPLLIVPSAVLPAALVPDEVNVLINPAHPGGAAFRVAEQRAFSFDLRLLARR